MKSQYFDRKIRDIVLKDKYGEIIINNRTDRRPAPQEIFAQLLLGKDFTLHDYIQLAKFLLTATFSGGAKREDCSSCLTFYLFSCSLPLKYCEFMTGFSII